MTDKIITGSEAAFDAEYAAIRKTLADKHGAILDGSTGEEVIRVPDELAPAFVEARNRESAAKGWVTQIKGAMLDLLREGLGLEAHVTLEDFVKAHKDARGSKTARIEGAGVRIKVELPGTFVSQEALRAVVEKFPELSKRFIKVERYAPIAAEVKKLMGTTGGPELEEIKRILLAGTRLDGQATFTVEEDVRQ